jgi:hypothetical protein
MARLDITYTIGGDVPSRDVSLPRGEPLTVALTLLRSPGVAYDLTGGFVVLALRPSDSADWLQFAKPGDTAGAVAFTLTAAQTAAFVAGQYELTLKVFMGADVFPAIDASSLFVRAATSGPATGVDDAGTYRFGVGAADLQAADLAAFTAVPGPLPEHVTLSPASQKCYFVVPAALPAIEVLMSDMPVPMLASRSVTMAGVASTVYETPDLMTWTNLVFALREA